MKRKVVVTTVLLVLVLLGLFGAGVVSAQPAGGGATDNDLIPDFLDSAFLDVFLDPTNTSAVAEFAKIIILLLAVFLIYASLSYVSFPSNAGLRWGIAIAVGLLATILISQEELITALISYKALGVTLMLFIPIVVLAFFTFVVSVKISPFGIVIQRIAWLIYSLYLFFTAFGVTLVRLGWHQDSTGSTRGWFDLLFGNSINNVVTPTDPIVLTVMWIAALFVFVLFVLRNDMMTQWLSKEMREADMERYKDVVQRAKLAREADADSTRS